MSRINIEEDEDDNKILVTIPYDEDAKEALKEKFRARWDPEAKNWMIDGYDFTVQEVEAELKLHFPRAFR